MEKIHDWFYPVHYRWTGEDVWHQSINLYRSEEQFAALNGGKELYSEIVLGEGVIVYYGQPDER